MWQVIGVGVGGGGERGPDPEPRDEKGRVREPESGVWGEGGGGERVAAPELPHARHQLAEPAVEHRHPDDHVGRGGDVRAEDPGIVARQDECGEGKCP